MNRKQLAILSWVGVALFLLSLHFGAGGYGMMGLTLLGITILSDGKTSEVSTPEDHKVRDVRDRLYIDKPDKSPVYIIMSRTRRSSRPAFNEKVEWENDAEIPRSTTTNATSNAGSAGDPVTLANFARVDIFSVGDILRLPANATTAGAKLRVTAVNTTDTEITVVRYDGGTSSTWGTVPALANNELIVCQGRVDKEGFTIAPSVNTMPSQDFNFLDSASGSFSITGRRAKNRNYTVPDYQRKRDRAMWKFQRDAESKLMFGKRSKKFLNGENSTSVGGLLGGDYTISKSLTYTANTFGHTDLIEFGRRIFADNGGSDLRFAFCGSRLLADIDIVGEDKVRRVTVDMRQTLGYGVQALEFAGGRRLALIHQPLFDEQGTPREGLVLDLDLIEYIPHQPLRVHEDTHRTNGNKRDEFETSFDETFSMCFMGDREHARIIGAAS